MTSGTPSSSAVWPCPEMAGHRVLGTFEGMHVGTRHLHSSVLLSPSGKQHHDAPSPSRSFEPLNKSHHY